MARLSARLVLSYVLAVGLPLLVLAGVFRAGSDLTAPSAAGGISSTETATLALPNTFLLLAQVAVIVLVSQIVGSIFRRLRQPHVMGEMVAGIMLGPSLFGWLAPGAAGMLFPPESIGALAALSQLGLLLFMFLVGLSTRPGELRSQGHAAVLTSHAGIVAPFVLAAVLSLYLYPRLSDDSVSFVAFALFMGAAMSVTAFPVLARILTERKMLATRTGTLAIACAAVNDVTGWCILAYIVILVRASDAALPLWIAPVGLSVFAVFMVVYVRRKLRGLEAGFLDLGSLSTAATTAMLLVALSSALVTEALGLHLLFGAFLAGAIMPKHSAFVAHVRDRLESVTLVLLLPLFFALTGLRTRIDLITGAEMWFYCALIVAVAIAGKLGGSMLAARAAGMNWREAGILGVLLNTRGLMEIVILNIGLDIHVISPALFSMMVIMALVTTLMTSPVLDLLTSRMPVAAGEEAGATMMGVGSGVGTGKFRSNS
jgi:Kef-type K+ transport system membrane component KefB